MSAANIKAGIEISAEVKGEEVVAKLAKTIEEAGIDTAALTERGKELSQTFARLDKAAALAEQFKKLKTQTQEVAAELSHAQAQTASLAREMKANPSKELEKQFKAAAAEAGRLKQRKAELAVETHNTRKALAEAGISTKKLAQEERRLAAESEKARQDLAALNEEVQKLKRLADAKIALGLHVDVQANKEMQRLNRSYAELKQNGSLTKRELKAATAAYERELRRLSQTMDGIPSKQTAISSSVAGMGRTMLAAAGVGGGIYAVNEGLRRIIDTPQCPHPSNLFQTASSCFIRQDSCIRATWARSPSVCCGTASTSKPCFIRPPGCILFRRPSAATTAVLTGKPCTSTAAVTPPYCPNTPLGGNGGKRPSSAATRPNPLPS